MTTIIYALDGNRAAARAEQIREKGLVAFARQINQFCGQGEKCETLIMLDPSQKIEQAHKGCEVVREFETESKKPKPPTVNEITKILEEAGVEIPKTAKKKEDFEKLLADYEASLKEKLTTAKVEFKDDATLEELQALVKAQEEPKGNE